MKKKISAWIAALMLCLCAGTAACKEEEHVHVFGEWEVVKEATCAEDGAMRRTCVDGDYYEEERIDRLGHIFGTDNVCIRCGYRILPTEGLDYRSEGEGLLVAAGTATAGEIAIPAYYEGKPVLGVAAEGFLETDVTAVFFPDGLQTVGVRAFYGCEALTECDLPNSVQNIGIRAFGECTALELLRFGPELTEIGAAAFYGCEKLTAVELPDGVVSVGGEAFAGCTKLDLLEMGDSLTQIGDCAFSDCASLRKVYLGKNVVTIEAFAFRRCTNLREVVLYSSLETIGQNVFQNCDSLQIIRYHGTKEGWKTIDKAIAWDGSGVGEYIVECNDGTLSGYEAL